MCARLCPAVDRKRSATEATLLVPDALEAAPRFPKRPCVDSVLPASVQEAQHDASHAPYVYAPPPKRAREDAASNPPSP
eukprot:6063564-Karenia_brevis.AAC.1